MIVLVKHKILVTKLGTETANLTALFTTKYAIYLQWINIEW